jgi:YD repeat-containing protein
MATATTRYGFPYQESDDPPDGAALGQNLAEAVEADLGSVDDRVTVLNGRANSVDTSITTLNNSVTTLGSSVTALKGKTVSGITRDTQDRVTGYTEAGEVWSAITYDTSGRVSAFTVDGTVHAVTYNASGQISGVS